MCDSLSITSRSSHGQTTRGSSMTVEVFYPGDNDSEGDALREFARRTGEGTRTDPAARARHLSCSMTGVRAINSPEKELHETQL